ncbi:MAG: hypothetical protein GF317_02605 [Candidatus Lokiarchaeota archaeon]|nr:hypothetical protein [Candidatus Lokiarchaeota archaeon]MBD3198797.1 hypothetical protein [Candidatus Lokiarchaeota archaeon]
MVKLEKEDIEIPVEEDNISLKASIYSTSNTPTSAPFIINMPGLLDHRESKFVKFYSEKFAKAGFYVLVYDYRAHGETKKETGSRWDKMILEIFSDLDRVINWTLKTQSKKIQNRELHLFGRSLGGAIILTHGFMNDHTTKLIALCTRYDYHTTIIKFPEETIRKMSPKYFLETRNNNNKRIMIAHCNDDKRIPFKNVNQIQSHLGLSNSNVLQYESGGHSFRGHREEIFKKALEFLKN